MSYLEIDNASIGFGPPNNRTEVLTDVNLSVEENEFVAIVGFSGAGKSTLISLLAGLTQPDKGEIRIGGKVIQEPSPRHVSKLLTVAMADSLRQCRARGEAGLY